MNNRLRLSVKWGFCTNDRIYMALHERQIKGLVNPADCLIGLLSVGFETDALLLVQCVYVCVCAL